MNKFQQCPLASCVKNLVVFVSNCRELSHYRCDLQEEITPGCFELPPNIPHLCHLLVGAVFVPMRASQHMAMYRWKTVPTMVIDLNSDVSSQSTENGSKLKQILRKYGLSNVMKDYTRVTESCRSTIDLSITGKNYQNYWSFWYWNSWPQIKLCSPKIISPKTSSSDKRSGGLEKHQYWELQRILVSSTLACV